MSRAIAIAKRELNSYFVSPVAYVTMTLFLLACGTLFWDDFRPGQPVAMRSLLEWMVWLLVLVIPMLSMGLLAQEWATGTIETMMTAPIDESEMVLGKFLGSFFFFVVLLLPTIIYVILLKTFGQLDVGPIACGYLGIVLVGALFIAVGLFCSSLTHSQVVAAVTAAAMLFVITIVPWWVAASVSLSDVQRKVVEQGVYNRYADFARGMLDLGNVVFFVAATAVFLFLTVKVLESRRWK